MMGCEVQGAGYDAVGGRHEVGNMSQGYDAGGGGRVYGL